MFIKEQQTLSDEDFDSAFLSFFDSGSLSGGEYQCFKEPIDNDVFEMNLESSFEKIIGEEEIPIQMEMPIQMQTQMQIPTQSDSSINTLTNIILNDNLDIPIISDENIISSASQLLSTNTKEMTKRGRRPTKKISNDSNSNHITKEPIHTKESIDNIRRKIKTHYVQFIISFFNEVIAVKFQSKPKLELKPIDYKVIKNITQSVNHKLFQMKLKDFLNLPLSSRVKFNRNQNVNIITSIINSKDECLNELLDMSMSDFYDTIYLGKPKEIRSKYGLIESRTKKQFDTKNQLHFFEEDLDLIDKKEERYYYLTKEIGMTLTTFFQNKTIKPFIGR